MMRFAVSSAARAVFLVSASAFPSTIHAASHFIPKAENRIASELATNTQVRVAEALRNTDLPEVDALSLVAARAVDAIAGGDWRALHRIATDKGAVREPSRLETMRLRVKDRPAEMIPPNADGLTDDEVIAENNRFCRPLVRVDATSPAVTPIGLQFPFDSFNALMHPTAVRTDMRRKYAGQPIMAVNCLHVPEDVAKDQCEAFVQSVIVEFEGESFRGPLMAGVVFFYNRHTGWLPGGIFVAGARMGLPQ